MLGALQWAGCRQSGAGAPFWGGHQEEKASVMPLHMSDLLSAVG